MIWKSSEALRQMRRVFLDKCPEAKCREKPSEKSGLEPMAPSRSEDIALHQLSQILNYKTDGSLVNFMPFQSRKPNGMLIMDIRRNADRLPLIYTATLSRFGSGSWKGAVKKIAPTATVAVGAIFFQRPLVVYAGLRRCMQARSHPEHAAAKRGHHRLFFFGPRKRGVRLHPPNPLGYVPDLALSNLTSLLIAIDRNGFRRTKKEGQVYSTLPQIFSILPRDLVMIFQNLVMILPGFFDFERP